jgi:hypothetical protein
MITNILQLAFSRTRIWVHWQQIYAVCCFQLAEDISNSREVWQQVQWLHDDGVTFDYN